MKSIALQSCSPVRMGQVYNLIRKGNHYQIEGTGLTVKVERLSYWFKPFNFKYGK